ncbi:MAG: 3-oxoacid CoA-transferase [Chloroflexi bacterium HGW-Chloroflexi-1]|nr:MAG: 3-oxoacid CoA-transferase [Chloroflexi bacterium HGW-Chloroflexi-1]
MAETDYTSTELLACVAARLLEDRKSVFVGTGLPMIAAMLAQRTTAPGLLIIFEAGGIGPQVPVLPISVGDSRTFHKAVSASSMHDVMSIAQAGYLDFGFLGAAQIDPYGNINTTVIGPHDAPIARLPGSGGANDVGSFCHRTIIIMRQDHRKFAAQLDFLTTPGYLTGPGARERAGLPADCGPHRVITQLGVYGFDDATRKMYLMVVHPGVTVEEVQANSGFPIPAAEPLTVSAPPTAEERRILREIDPEGLLITR